MALRSQNFLLQRYIDKAMVDLPALPNVIIQVLQATEKESVQMAEIEDLLSTDAAITTKMLKVVNSAYFGLPRQVGSVGQALSILGMHQIRNMTLSVGVLNALNSPNPRVVEIQRQFWQHSFAAATCAQTLARRVGLNQKEQEQIFVGGLLHDVGRLFLSTFFHQPYTQVMTEAVRLDCPLATVEERVLGTTHAQLGGILAEKWNFPQSLCDMIRRHERFDDDEPLESPERLFCVHIADRLASEIWVGQTASNLYPWDPQAAAWLNYGDEQRLELRAEVEEFVQRASELLGVI